MNTCKSCKKEHSKLNPQKRCKPCQDKIWNASNKKKNEKINLILTEMKSSIGGKCKKCGENRFHVLDFHHIDPSLKSETVTNIIRYYGFGAKSIAKTQEEVNKCVLLCSNCHRDFHHQEHHKGISIKEYLNAPFV